MADALLKVSSGKLNLLFKTCDQFGWKSIFCKTLYKKEEGNDRDYDGGGVVCDDD